MIRKILITLKVVQEVDNEKRAKQGLGRLGKGFFKARRLNPYNPLSYFLVGLGVLIIPIIGIFGGIYDVIKTLSNPFKWD